MKYYFDAGWYNSAERTSGAFKVMLRCDSYDTDVTDMSASIDIELPVYEDGTWETDSSGTRYFYYNLSKIIANTTVTITYKDGTTVKERGKTEVDGYYISFLHNQSKQHWYPVKDENYTANTLTVKVLDKTFDLEIPITSQATAAVYGKIIDFNGDAVSGAKIYKNGVNVATTDSNGVFYTYSIPGVVNFAVEAQNAVKRSFKAIITTEGSKNDFTATPVEICTVDYSGDGCVNAKDFYLMKKTLSQEEFTKQKGQFEKNINFSSTSYDELTLNK